MPGLFAVVSEREVHGDGLDAAVEALRVQPWFAASRHVAVPGRVSLGRVTSGVFGPPEPAVDGRRVAYMEGEIRNAPELRAELGLDAAGTEAELVVALAAQGPPAAWLPRCRGAFAILIWDAKARTIVVANDRLGLRPHYCATRGEDFALAPSVAFLRRLPWVTGEIHPASVVEYFAFQCVLEDRTLLRDVTLLPYGSVLTFDVDAGTLEVERYRDFDHLPESRDVAFRDVADEVAEALVEAVRRAAATDHRYGVLLSGGLDSRLVLGAIPRDRRPVHAYTFGLPDSLDIPLATAVARRAGAVHHVIPFESGAWLRERADRHLALTEGTQCLLHAHGFHMVDAVRERVDVSLSGFAGDTVLGGSKLHEHLVKGPQDWSSLLRTIHRHERKIHGMAFTRDGELRQLFQDRFWNDPERPSPFEALAAALERFRAFRFENVADCFTLVNRDRKTLLGYFLFARPWFEDRAPFVDEDFLDVVLSLPARHRLHRKLQKAVLERVAPRLGSIPVTNTGRIPTRRRWPRRVRSVTERLRGLAGTVAPRKEYEDYAGWLRRDLADLVRSVLLDERTADRGILDPDLVRSAVDQHLRGGEDCTWKIGTMLTFEMACRLLADA